MLLDVDWMGFNFNFDQKTLIAFVFGQIPLVSQKLKAAAPLNLKGVESRLLMLSRVTSSKGSHSNEHSIAIGPDFPGNYRFWARNDA